MSQEHIDDDTPPHVRTWLKKASEGNLSSIKELVDMGASVNVQDSYGFSALYMAVRNQKEDAVDFLLNHGADPNIKTSFGDTPLHSIFFSEGRKSLVLRLIKSGAEIDPQNNDLETPLMHGVRSSIVRSSLGWERPDDLLLLLIDHGADIFAKDKTGESPAQVIHENGSHGDPDKRIFGRNLSNHVKSAMDKKLLLNDLEKTGMKEPGFLQTRVFKL